VPPFLLLYIDFNPGYPVHQTVPADDIPIDALNLYVRTYIMGFATHLGPWLLGTVKNTTGTTAGTIRNMGATIVSQQLAIGATNPTAATAFVLPAGATITSIFFNCTTLYGAGTLKLSIGATDITNTATLPTTTAGVVAFTLGAASVTAAGLINNVGSTDAIVTVTQASATTGAGTIVIAYVVRESDGSANPSAFNQ
jgi:hypothetical protein